MRLISTLIYDQTRQTSIYNYYKLQNRIVLNWYIYILIEVILKDIACPTVDLDIGTSCFS